MVAIIFRGNFMVRGQFSRGQFSSEAIILGGNCPGSNYRGAIIQGAVIPEAIFLGDNHPRTLNTCSLSKNIDDLEHLVQSTKTDFDTIAVSESRITRNKLPPIDTSIPNYSCKFCPMEANTGGTLIYIRNHLSYKTKNDLKIYKSFELESTFIEICNPKKTNIITGLSINIQI